MILDVFCGGGQAAKARGCNPLIPGFKSQLPLFFKYCKIDCRSRRTRNVCVDYKIKEDLFPNFFILRK